MSTREQLEQSVNEAKAALDAAQSALQAFTDAPENNRFPTLEEAEGELYERMIGWAREACEGSYCFGDDEYTQDFYVGDDLYRATLTVEYNRHDKQYYYVDGDDFKTEKL